MLFQKYKILWSFFLRKAFITLPESSPFSSCSSVPTRSPELATVTQLYLLLGALHIVNKAIILSTWTGMSWPVQVPTVVL